MAGRGRGGRGIRLAEALQKMQVSQLGGGDDGSSQPSGSGASSPASSSSPEPSIVPMIGGRGKLKQFILSKPDSSNSSSGSRSGNASPEPTDPGAGPSRRPGGSGGGGDGPSRPPGRGGDDAPILPPMENKAVGTEGRRLDVACNFVRLARDKDRGIYEYHVDFEPSIDSRSIRHRILKTSDLEAVIGPVFQFTGMNIFLPHRLQEEQTVATSRSPTSDQLITVTITFVKIPPAEELVPFFNTTFRRIMHQLRLVQINRHYYDPNARIDIPQHKLEVWPGLVTAITEYDGGLMLNCDVSHRILRTNTAKDVLQEIFQLPDGKAKFKDYAYKKLVGCVVLTRYNNKPYRIDDIEFSLSPESTFTLSSGRQITYTEYFREHWETEIKDKRQPLLVHRPKLKKGQTESQMVCLIPELSYMTGLTDDIRADTRAMRDIASHTRIKPLVRHQKLQQFINNVNQDREAVKILSDWGLSLSNNPLLSEARQIRPEVLYFGNNKTVEVNFKAEWANDARNSQLIEAIQIKRWLLIFTRRDAAKADEFIQTLQQVSRNMGFQFAQPRKIEIRDDLPASYCNAIKESSSGAQLVCVMTPGSSQREDRYSAIKRLCCADLGVPSQVLRSNTITGNKMRAVCQNIALQITCKVGGQLWAIKIPFNSVMIVGLDVYHDALQKGKSVVGVVASMNPECTKWYTQALFQNPKEEIVALLQAAMVSCLKKFYETNNHLPARVFIYRDGVGDGQLSVVRNFEIPQVEDAINNFVKVYTNDATLISLIIVQKRVNVKMLMRKSNDLDNPPPGSIMDHTITKRQFYNFYLVSQHVNQGTVTPTHYVTLYDKNNMTPDRMQRLTYKMTHLYYNFPATIRVPAPCQYAHKVAYLIGQNVKRAPNELLCDKLFFL